MFVPLDDFDQRKDPSRSARAILSQLYTQYGELRDALVLVLLPPSSSECSA